MVISRHLALATPNDSRIVHDLHHLVDDRKACFVPFACFTVYIAVALARIPWICNSVVIPQTARNTILLSCCEILCCPGYTSLSVIEVRCTHLTDNNRDISIEESITHTLEDICKVSRVSACEY